MLKALCRNLTHIFFFFFMHGIGEKWSCFSVLPRDEHYGGTKRGQAALDWSPHCSWCLLLWLPWGAWLEVWTSLRGNTEVQGREIHTREVKNSQGKLVVKMNFWLIYPYASLSVLPLANLVNKILINWKNSIIVRCCAFFLCSLCKMYWILFIC